MIISRSPVRISFAGGGTDLPAFYARYGGAVLSASIDKYFYTILTERNDNLIQIISSDLKIIQEIGKSDPLRVDGALRIPLAVIHHLNCRKGFNLFLASEIMPGTGLGSSASVCVNILNILSTYLGEKINKFDLAERAFTIAKEVLNEPVGKQDEFAASFGGINIFEFDNTQTTVTPLRLEPHIFSQLEKNLLLFFTGSSRRSTEILREQENLSAQNDGNLTEALLESKGLIAEMRNKLIAGRLLEFGKLLDRGWQIKKRFSPRISTPDIDRYYEVAKQHGAVGGKITGAGGGGFLMFYCEADEQASVRDALIKEGLTPMSIHIDMQGASIIYNDPFMNSNGNGRIWKFLKYQ